MALSSFHRRKLQTLFDTQDTSSYARLAVDLIDRGLNPLEAAPELFEDDFMDFHFQALQAYFNSSQGEIYAAALVDKEDVYKVGMTGKTAKARERTLNTAAVLVDLHMVKAVSVYDRFWAEKQAHDLLSNHRIKGEFFQIKYAELFAVLDFIAQADCARKEKTLRI